MTADPSGLAIASAAGVPLNGSRFVSDIMNFFFGNEQCRSKGGGKVRYGDGRPELNAFCAKICQEVQEWGLLRVGPKA